MRVTERRLVVHGHEVRLETRSDPRNVYTWVEVFHGGCFHQVGDPWPCGRRGISKAELSQAVYDKLCIIDPFIGALEELRPAPEPKKRRIGHRKQMRAAISTGDLVTIKAGDTVRFKRGDGAVCTDVVRHCFTAHSLLEPYARNTSAPAVVLTEHSWTWFSSIIEVVRYGINQL